MLTCNAVSYRGSDPFIFFSFYKEDAPIVYPVIERLAMEGYRICFDDGSQNRKDILKQLLKSNVCIMAISEAASNDHSFCEDLSFALKAKNGCFSLLMADFPLRPSLKLYLENTRCIKAFDCADEEQVYKSFFDDKSFDSCRDANARPDHAQLAAWRGRAKEYIQSSSEIIYDAFGEDSVYIQNWYSKADRKRDPAGDEEERCAEEESERRKKEGERLSEEEKLRKEIQEMQQLLETLKKKEKEKQREDEEARRREEEAQAEQERREQERKEQEQKKQDKLEQLRKEKKQLEELIKAAAGKGSSSAGGSGKNGQDDDSEDPDERTIPVDPKFSESGDDREDSDTVIKEDPSRDDDATVMKPRTHTALLIRLNTGTQYQLDRLENRIGRAEGQVNVLVLGNSGISRVHAQIFQLDGHFKLQDLGSKFGTGLNGRDLEKDEVVDLPQTALIRMADEEFAFLSGSDKEQAEMTGCVFFLRAVRTGEPRQLEEGALPLDRNHPWDNGVLKEQSVSRAQHAVLVREDGECRVRALKSANGTYLNGRRMGEQEELPLRSGDKISIGHAEDFEYLEIKIKREG